MISEKDGSTHIETKPLPSLEEMLANAPKTAFQLTKEDRQFLSSTVGSEIVDYD